MRDPVVRFSFRPIDEPTAREVLSWHYEPPYDVYDARPADLETDVRVLLDPGNGYHAILDGGALVAYCCFGPEARVPGGDYATDALDVGGGLRPSLTGRGLGPAVLDAIALFAWRRFGRRPLRETVAAFNRRALRACEREGFREVSRFRQPGNGEEFVILVRDPPAA